MNIKQHLLTRKETAEYLRVHVQTLNNWASTGKYNLKYLKIGGRCFYRPNDIEEWMKSRERTQTEN